MPRSELLRPTKHHYDPDPLTDGVTCAHCGMPFAFGALHPETPDNAEDGYELPPVCRDCGHYAHSSGSCSVLLSSWPKPIACRCGEVAA